MDFEALFPARKALIACIPGRPRHPGRLLVLFQAVDRSIATGEAVDLPG